MVGLIGVIKNPVYQTTIFLISLTSYSKFRFMLKIEEDEYEYLVLLYGLNSNLDCIQ